MKSCIALCLLALVAGALSRPDETKYTNKYDSVNVDEVIHNERLFDSYMKCMMETGKCTIEGNELKSHTREALETYCEKCTDVQKEKIRVVIGFMINKKPEAWEQLTTKYDPTKKYSTKYEKELKNVKA